MDVLTRGTALNDEVRVFCCRTAQLVRKAQDSHDLWPTAAAALGRVLTTGCMMGSMLKDKKEKIEIQIDGRGPLGQIVVDGYHDGRVRGFVQNPHVHEELSPEKLDVGKAVGTDGFLRVVKDMGMKQPFISEVALQTGEIGDDFAYYFYISEQSPSVVSVGVSVGGDHRVKSAGGLIIQLLPNAAEETIRIIEDITKYLKPISQLMSEYEEPIDLLNDLFEDYKELDRQELRFECECRRGKFARVLSKLPTADLQTMIDEDGGAEVVCKFCGKKYRFEKETLQGYINGRK